MHVHTQLVTKRHIRHTQRYRNTQTQTDRHTNTDTQIHRLMWKEDRGKET